MAGLPGISVPVGLDFEGLPLGLQLIGRPFSKKKTLFGGTLRGDEGFGGIIHRGEVVVARGLA